MTWIEDGFPNLDRPSFKVTSPEDGEYNCIAWAARDDRVWWTHHPGYRWPGYAPRTALVSGLVAVFEGMGYEECESPDLEVGYEKIAIYARHDLWTHAARQLPDGTWTSKLGDGEDINHAKPQCLIGNTYGDVYCYVKRPSQ